jgi:hypothetical protein
MLIWSGFGILVPIITFVTIFVAKMVIDTIFGASAAFLPNLLVCLAPLVVLWFLGKSLNKNGADHTFFFIRIEYWGVMMAVVLILFGLFR